MLATLSFLLAAKVPLPGSPHTFRAGPDSWLLDGQPFVVRSGEIHPARVPREYWADRLKRIRALGLNTISIYLFWNLLEPEPDQFDFSGQNDIAAFVREAGKQGLFVTLRAGPYVCAEWEWGGFPYWLANLPDIAVRQNNPAFLKAAGEYLDAVGKQLAPLTVSHGGPIILAQVENEYGSFGRDHAYTSAIRKAYEHAGFDCQLYTADGPGQDMLGGGAFHDLPAAINFGGGPEGSFKELAKFRTRGPQMNGEYWCGWFDHWYEGHHTTSAQEQAADIEWMLSRNISLNLYMVHGGTTFGFMNGANSGGKGFEPDTTSYDYDAPIAEDGTLTPKYWAFRDVYLKHLSPGEKLPEPPKPLAKVEIPPFELAESAPLLGSKLPEPYLDDNPPSFERMRQPYGFVLYRTRVAQAFAGQLDLQRLQDRAQIYVNSKLVGTLERQKGEHALSVEIPAGATLDLLVENQGRVNFSRALLNEHKGIGAVRLGQTALTDWKAYPFPLKDPEAFPFKKRQDISGPTLFRGSFGLRQVGDTYLDLRGWSKGNVWVNGHNLGRYWHVGPQQTLYVPAPWLHRGRNEVIVLDLQPTGPRSIQGITQPVFETPR
jgi:beta-galactosidase